MYLCFNLDYNTKEAKQKRRWFHPDILTLLSFSTDEQQTTFRAAQRSASGIEAIRHHAT